MMRRVRMILTVCLTVFLIGSVWVSLSAPYCRPTLPTELKEG